MKLQLIRHVTLATGLCLALGACSRQDDLIVPTMNIDSNLGAIFDGQIDLNNLENYANQFIPPYINRDNSGANPVSDAGATLGRVLFYDTKLSVDNTVSCASCHQQAFAFSDGDQTSTGVAGSTGRHSMRLINSRFSNEAKFFWDERAASLEQQTTQPIQDHVEMGFSGANGDPSLADALDKIAAEDYYQKLFTFVFGDAAVTEARLQLALAQFVRSIQSFDSRYDTGRSAAPNDGAPFANFTAQENQGKALFLAPPQFNGQGVRVGGGVGCAGCHQPPGFDIDPNSRNNGLIRTIDGGTIDLAVTRSPSLRDVVRSDGSLNGGLMHTGDMSIADVLDHYDLISVVDNNNLDQRLRPAGQPQNLVMSQAERDALAAFLSTLSGSDVYTDERWSNPFVASEAVSGLLPDDTDEDAED